LPFIVLILGVLIVSTAAIMIKGAIDLGAPPLTIAAGRMVLAAAILTPIALGRTGGEIRRLKRRDWFWGLGAGVCLALHFALWISSLAYTSVASSVMLVTTNPVFVALVSWILFRERLSPGGWGGVLLTMLGSVLVGLSDRGGPIGSNPLLGDVLALLGAMSISCYFLVGRNLRARLSLLPYIWLVYSSAAVVLLIAVCLAGQPLFGLPVAAYLLMLGLALGPQLLGHTAFNWVLKYLTATLVTVAILGEPIGSALLAWLIFDQPVRGLQFLGGAILLTGIAATTLAEHKSRQSAAKVLQAEGEFAP
jgi:drug/metabolite transporter (DMT)-like permease